MAFVQLILPDGSCQEHRLQEPATIGSGVSAGIRLVGLPALCAEHILLAPQGDKIWVSTAQGGAPAMQNGRALQPSYVDWGSRFEVAGLKIILQKQSIEVLARPADNRQAAGADTSAKRTAHPVLLVAGALAIGLLAMQFLSSREQGPTFLSDEDVELFRDARNCDAKNPRHAARTLTSQAVAHQERYVFDPQAGIQAVHRFGDAALCFEQSGSSDLARGARAQARVLRERIEEDLKQHKLRLDRALQSSGSDDVQPHLAFLREISRHIPDSNFALALRSLQVELLNPLEEE